MCFLLSGDHTNPFTGLKSAVVPNNELYVLFINACNIFIVGKQVRTKLSQAFNHWLNVPEDKIQVLANYFKGLLIFLPRLLITDDSLT